MQYCEKTTQHQLDGISLFAPIVFVIKESILPYFPFTHQIGRLPPIDPQLRMLCSKMQWGTLHTDLTNAVMALEGESPL